jgi:cell division transport system ATP-binding protein
MIVFDQVTKKFGEKEILKKVSFSVGKGEFVFLVGPSGAGKTTILRLLIKEVTLDSGEIKIDKKKIKQIPKDYLRRQIGAAFQDFKVLEDRTVYENISLALEIEGKKGTEIEKSTKKMIDVVGLEGKENLFPQELSGGELQRTVLARAAVSQPKVIFADEPTGNLDPETAWQVINVLKKINRKQGTTVIAATHDVEIVNSLKERVISLKAGEIVKDEKKGEYKKI